MSKKTILIVDDVVTNTLILAKSLKNDYEIKVANNGQTALDIANKTPQPDIILLDIMMPGMDGFEVCKRLKDNPKTKDIPVLFITANENKADEEYGLSLGAVDYIKKPISIPITRARILTHVHLLGKEKQLKEEISKHKQAQEGLRVAGMVFNTTSEAMLLTNAENEIVAVNPAFCDVTGYSSDEIIGKTPAILSSGKQNKRFYELMWQSLQTTGKWQGELWNRRKNGDIYAEWLKINTIYNADNSIRQRVALFSDITEKKTSEETIWRQANYDPLTNLPNRSLFQERLMREIKRAKREQQSLALLFIDLDHFKEINDTLGHDVGDLLLSEASHRLSQCVRETDTVARLGGDEFTVILVDITDTTIIERIAGHIVECMKAPFILKGEEGYISASIGITLFPEDTQDFESLLKNADQAMYVSKELGRSRYTYFTQSMQDIAQDRIHLANDLRIALGENQFRLDFQPIVNMDNDVITKVEALIRWDHPQRGLISPNHFIPLVEELGLINKIGDWVFYEASKQLKHWMETTGQQIQMSINVSAKQITDGNEMDEWISHLNKLEIPCHLIVLEITERLLLNVTDQVLDRIDNLRNAGIKIAIDDFGIGYSALSYLRKFNIDYLKLDKSFVNDLATNPNDLALSEGIIVMAHKMGYQVIAEGVETSEQRVLLSNAGCESLQGFLYSKPVSAMEIESLLTKASKTKP